MDDNHCKFSVKDSLNNRSVASVVFCYEVSISSALYLYLFNILPYKSGGQSRNRSDIEEKVI